MGYQLTNDPTKVIRLDDGKIIEQDPTSSDWQAYSEWIKDGNTPDPSPNAPIVATPSPAQILADVLINKGVLTQADIDVQARSHGVLFFQDTGSQGGQQ